jgi:hypothetical protein
MASEDVTDSLWELRGYFVTYPPKMVTSHLQNGSRKNYDRENDRPDLGERYYPSGAETTRSQRTRFAQPTPHWHGNARQTGTSHANAECCSVRSRICICVQRNAGRQGVLNGRPLLPADATRCREKSHSAHGVRTGQGPIPPPVFDVNEGSRSTVSLHLRAIRPSQGSRPLATDIDRLGSHDAGKDRIENAQCLLEPGSHETEWRSIVRWPWRPAGRGSCQQTRVGLSRRFEAMGAGLALPM